MVSISVIFIFSSANLSDELRIYKTSDLQNAFKLHAEWLLVAEI